MNDRPIRATIIDLYNGEENQGIGCLQRILNEADGKINGQRITQDRYETRLKNEAPGLDHDIYISSGGPGSPFDGVGMAWENTYFNIIDQIWNYNQRAPKEERKHIFFICHSFQMMVRFFDFASVNKRKKKAFGILEVHKADYGLEDPLYKDLGDPYYCATFRDFQVVQPDHKKMEEIGARITALEKNRPYVPYERAIEGIRVSDEISGTQFHPEGDPTSMMFHFRKPERKQQVVDAFGEEKYDEMLRRLEDPDYITRTFKTVLPTFLRLAIEQLRPATTVAPKAVREAVAV